MDQKTLDEIRARWEATFGFGEKPDNRQYLERAVSIAQYDIPALLDALAELQAERDRYKARADVLERAIKCSCICAECAKEDTNDCTEDCYDYCEFEARFAEESERG